MASGGGRIVCGSVLGTGADLSVTKVGFRPKKVELFNVTGNCQAVWTESMADDSMQKTVDSGSGTTDMSFVASNGVTPLANGFAMGADGDLNVSAEIVHFVAHE